MRRGMGNRMRMGARMSRLRLRGRKIHCSVGHTVEQVVV